MKKGKIKVSYFFADWCYPSEKQIYNIRNVCHIHNTECDIVDVETEGGVKASVKYNVKNVPTILIFKGNKEIKRIKGNFGYKELDEYFANGCAN